MTVQRLPVRPRGHGAANPRSHGKSDTNRLIEVVGSRIARERIPRGFSIEELSQRGGVSTGLLSQVERGIGNPSLSSLVGLVDALQLPIGAFFGGGAGNDDDLVIRRDGRKRLALSDQGLVSEQLVPDLRGRLSMLHIELPPGFCNEDNPFVHPGEEGELVLEGELEAHVGARVFQLHPDDSIRFNCAVPHWFRTFDTSVIFISAMTSPSF